MTKQDDNRTGGLLISLAAFVVVVGGMKIAARSNAEQLLDSNQDTRWMAIMLGPRIDPEAE